MSHWFDDLTRALATEGLPRRQVLRRLGAGLAGLSLSYLFPELTSAAPVCKPACPAGSRCIHGTPDFCFCFTNDAPPCGRGDGRPGRCCRASEECTDCPPNRRGVTQICCEPGSVCVLSSRGFPRCAPRTCPAGTTLCGVSDCCRSGETCINGSCCPNSLVCGSGSNRFCCPPGQVCCGDICCPTSQQCCGALFNQFCCAQGQVCVTRQVGTSVIFICAPAPPSKFCNPNLSAGACLSDCTSRCTNNPPTPTCGPECPSFCSCCCKATTQLQFLQCLTVCPP